MERLRHHDPLVRRQALIRSLSWRLFWLATTLSTFVFGWAVLEVENVRTWQAAGLICLIPTLVGFLAGTYLWWIFSGPFTWQERGLLLVLRLLLWLGCLWQLLCVAYLAVALLLSRGFVIWLPS